MKAIRTKRRKSKKFDWQLTEATCVFVVTGNTWYMRQVECLRLGDWAYHWLYDGYYTVFHCLTCSMIGHYTEEVKARRLVKKLHYNIRTMPKENIFNTYSNWISEIRETVIGTGIEMKLPESVTYNPDEDIPF